MEKPCNCSGSGSNTALYVVGGLIVFGGILAFLFTRNRGASGTTGSQSLPNTKPLPAGEYNNAEEWDVSYDKDGMPTKVTIHRHAVRSV